MTLKGFPQPTELFVISARAAAALSMVEQVRDAGLLPAGKPLVAMLSGGRDSVCLLDLAVRLLGPEAVTALHVNYGLRPEGADADEAHCATLCAGLGVRLEVERPRRPEGAGNLQSWARDTRYAAAAGLAESADALIATGHTADDQVETILYRLASSPSRRALLGMRARDGRLVRPLLAFTRERDHRLLRGAGPGLARRPEQRAADLRAQPGPPRARCRRSPRSTRRPPATSCARRRCCARRPRSSTPSSTPSSTAPARRRAARSPSSDWSSCRRPCAGSSSSGSPIARPAARSPGAARHADQVAALRRRARSMLDLGSGVRAVVERGMVRAERG